MATVWAYIEYQEGGSMKIKLLSQTFASRGAAQTYVGSLTGITVDNLFLEAVDLDHATLENEKTFLTAKINAASDGIYKRFLIELQNRINVLLGLPETPGGSDPGGGDPGGGPTQGAMQTIGSLTISGNLMVLSIVYLNGGWWLLRNATNVPPTWYYPSGGNLLTMDTADYTLPAGVTIISPDTGIGGLTSPETFPEAAFIAATGRYKNGSGEYVLEDPGTGGGDPGGGDPGGDGVNALISYSLPGSNNTTNFGQFATLSLPNPDFKICAGHGFPFYGQSSADAKALIDRGWTNLYAAEAYPRNPAPGWEPKNLYLFTHVYRMMTIAAREMFKNNLDLPEYGNLNGIAMLNGGELSNRGSINSHLDVGSGVDYSGLTTAGADELAKWMYRINGAAQSPDNPGVWDIPMTKSVMLLDEESINLGQSWAGGNGYSLLGYLSRGMYQEAMAQGGDRNFKLHWYAQPMIQFINDGAYNNYTAYTKSQIQSMFDGFCTYDTAVWKATPKYVNADGGYNKVPFIDNRYEIWQKSGASYVMSGGRRVPVNTDFTVTHFGKTMTILREPTMVVQFLVFNNNTWQQAYGNQTDPNTGQPYATWDGTKWNLNPSSVANGWGWHNVARPNSAEWDNEVNYFLRGIYVRADGIIGGQMKAAYIDSGNTAINIEAHRGEDNPANKTFVGIVQRPQTENWSAYGNSDQVRELGEQHIIFETLLALTSGIHLLDSWDDGNILGYPLRSQGESIYPMGSPQSDYWGRWVAKNAAFQSLLKKVEGTNTSSWKHIHFYYPCWGHKNYETIATGLYVGTKFYLLACNPTLGKDEVMNHTMKAGGSTYSVPLSGRNPVFLEFNVPSGLSATQFTLDYYNIYGTRIYVNGKVTKVIDDHYLS